MFFSKKYHIALTGIVIVLAVLCASISADGETYSLARLIGLGGYEMHIAVFASVLFSAGILLSYACYVKVKNQFYRLMFDSSYQEALQLITKNYEINKTLFYKHYIFYLFTIGDVKKINQINQSLSYISKENQMICNMYVCMYDYLMDKEYSCDLDLLIVDCESLKGKKFDVLPIINALNFLQLGKYNEAIDVLKPFKRIYECPILSLVVFKILLTAEKELGRDTSDFELSAKLVADNEFIFECYNKLNS